MGDNSLVVIIFFFSSAKGAEAARVANEYHQRKKEAAQYKARGQADMYGVSNTRGVVNMNRLSKTIDQTPHGTKGSLTRSKQENESCLMTHEIL